MKGVKLKGRQTGTVAYVCCPFCQRKKFDDLFGKAKFTEKEHEDFHRKMVFLMREVKNGKLQETRD
jgi:hypothetical protein